MRPSPSPAENNTTSPEPCLCHDFPRALTENLHPPHPFLERCPLRVLPPRGQRDKPTRNEIHLLQVHPPSSIVSSNSRLTTGISFQVTNSTTLMHESHFDAPSFPVFKRPPPPHCILPLPNHQQRICSMKSFPLSFSLLSLSLFPLHCLEFCFGARWQWLKWWEFSCWFLNELRLQGLRHRCTGTEAQYSIFCVFQSEKSPVPAPPSCISIVIVIVSIYSDYNRMLYEMRVESKAKSEVAVGKNEGGRLSLIFFINFNSSTWWLVELRTGSF